MDKIMKPENVTTDVGSLVKKGSSALDALKAEAAIPQVNVQEALVVLIDCSGSMDEAVGGSEYEKKLDAAKTSAKGLIQASQASHCAIISFGYDVDVLCRVGNRVNALGAIDTLFPRGCTQMLHGLKQSFTELELVQHKYQVRRTIMLTDGYATDAMQDDLVAEAARHKAAGYILDCVAFGTCAHEECLAAMAGAGGGVYKLAKNATELVKSFLQLEAKTRGLLTQGIRL